MPLYVRQTMHVWLLCMFGNMYCVPLDTRVLGRSDGWRHSHTEPEPRTDVSENDSVVVNHLLDLCDGHLSATRLWLHCPNAKAAELTRRPVPWKENTRVSSSIRATSKCHRPRQMIWHILLRMGSQCTQNLERFCSHWPKTSYFVASHLVEGLTHLATHRGPDEIKFDGSLVICEMFFSY